MSAPTFRSTGAEALAVPEDVRLEADARLSPEEVNAAYGWVDWPAREAWRIQAVSRTCTWFAARDVDGELVGIARLLDDGGLHAAIWDVVVRPDRQRGGIGSGLVHLALARCADRRLVAVVSTPAAAAFFARLGFTPESHGHQAMYLRPRTDPDHEHA